MLFRDHDRRLRQEGMRVAVETVAAKGGLRPGVTLDEAADVLFTLISPSTYR
jgi:hypothetical protein